LVPLVPVAKRGERPAHRRARDAHDTGVVEPLGGSEVSRSDYDYDYGRLDLFTAVEIDHILIGDPDAVRGSGTSAAYGRARTVDVFLPPAQ